jgi:hypothetical protein
VWRIPSFFRLVWLLSCKIAFGVADSELFALGVARQMQKVGKSASPNRFSREAATRNALSRDLLRVDLYAWNNYEQKRPRPESPGIRTALYRTARSIADIVNDAE